MYSQVSSVALLPVSPLHHSHLQTWPPSSAACYKTLFLRWHLLSSSALLFSLIIFLFFEEGVCCLIPGYSFYPHTPLGLTAVCRSAGPSSPSALLSAVASVTSCSLPAASAVRYALARHPLTALFGLHSLRLAAVL